MFRIVFGACGLAACVVGFAPTQAFADTIQFGGKTYVTIDWDSASAATDMAVGSLFGNTVTYDGVHVHGNKVFENSYLGDDGFDALTFGTGDIDNIKVGGGVPGFSTIDFGQPVNDVLLLIGISGDKNQTKWGPSFWDFQDDVILQSVDAERDPGLTAVPQKLVDNLGPGHQNGVVRLTGEFSSLTWWQDSPQGGLDKMRITFAVAQIPAPAPLALLGLAGLASRRRRRRRA